MADRALRALNRRVATLVILIAIGALARLTALQTTPPGLHPDEAVNAYEARRLAESLAADDQRVTMAG